VYEHDSAPGTSLNVDQRTEDAAMDLIETPEALGKPGGRHPHQLARLAFVRDLVRPIIPDLRELGAAVLDVGCGDAFVVAGLARQRPETAFFGFDPGLADLPDRESVCGADLPNLRLHADLEDIDCRAGSVGLVLLLDVLEHVEDDSAFLQQIASNPITADRATFVITAPAFPRLFSEHDRLLKHQRRYTMRGLLTAIEGARLRPRERGFVFGSLLLPRLLQVLVQKLRRKPGELSPWQGGAIRTELYKAALLLDIAVMRLLHRAGLDLPGLSCYAVCEKSDAS